MATRKKSRAWNVGRDLFPGLATGAPFVPAPPDEDSRPVGTAGAHSTPDMLPAAANYRIERVRADGARELVMVGAQPWVGTARNAAVEVQRLSAAEPGCRFEVVADHC